MFGNQWVVVTTVALAAAATVGCSKGRDVEVTGSVSAPAGQALATPISLTFYDVIEDGETPESVAETKLESAGEFAQTVALEGDTVRVRALVDTNADGKCSAGELWAEADAPIADDDSVEPVALTLAAAACPSE